MTFAFNGQIDKRRYSTVQFANSVADPDPGSGAFLTPGSGIDKKNQDPDPDPD
jgi:hypothetical protein